MVADTIEELAEGLGLPAETLKKTVERQNENYDAGVDPDFGKRRASLVGNSHGAVLWRSHFATCCARSTALRLTKTSRLSTTMARRSKACNVTGVDSGSYYAHTYPNMSTGNCCGRSVTFDRTIGKTLAAK